MKVPPSGSYKILEVKPTQGASVKVSFQSQDDQFDEPVGPVYATQRFCKSPLKAGEIGHAEFEIKESRDAKPGDKGYLAVSVWCPVGGVPPVQNPTGGTALPYKPPQYHLDTRDKSIIAQVSVKCASEIYASKGKGIVEGAAEEIISLAKELFAGTLEVAGIGVE